MLGVVTGLRSEARILRGVAVACISIGGKADGAEEKIARLIEGGATGLVSFGIAGALHPDMRTGDVVVAEAVTSEAGEVWLAHKPWIDALRLANPHPSLPGLTRQSKFASASATRELGSPGLDAARRPGDDERDRGAGRQVSQMAIPAPGRDDDRAGVKVGALLGLDHLLSSPADKTTAFSSAGCVAVDMESHHVARAAAAHGLPFIAVRAISDRADQALPAAFANFVDGEGRTRMSAVLAALILGRVKLGELIAAGRSSRLAHQALFRCRGALAGLR